MAIIGVGIDIEEIKRFIDRPFEDNSRFYKKIFTEQEISYSQAKKNPSPHFAVRFAAKEAAIKAFSGLKKLHYRDITIQNDENGKPHLSIVREEIKKELNIDKNINIYVSLSHSDANAVACVIVEGNE